MIARIANGTLSTLLSFILVTAPPEIMYGFQSSPGSANDDSGNPTDPAPMSASELQALVAPIALYPDSLVAQILGASTFPDQVAVAEYWLQQNQNLAGSALMQAVNNQSWDPSVKALTQFPSVLDNLAKNLSWTSSLGEAYHNQSADVMAAIQVLRAQAKSKGNLKSSSQITVVQQTPQTIVIQSANPEVVYVPQYNPAVIYGYPYVVPGYVAPVYSTGDMVAASMLSFGAGIAVGAMMGGGCCSWGYSSWNCGWHGTAVVYHGGAYYGNSAWHGGYYNGGYHNSYGYNNAYNHNYNNAYNHSNNYNNHSNNGNSYRGGGNTYNNVNVNKQGAQNFSANHSSASNSWAQHDDSSLGKSTAFSGMGGRSGGIGNSGGWSSRAESGRGFGSMQASGFGGGRFGGGGFGGGGFRGGGGRR
ncbi:MAG: DUF3300 domain-containing protein [Terracidiphilus sp.]